MTRINDITDTLAKIDHDLAKKWIGNDLIKKNLATSYDYWLEDTEIPMSLKDFIIQYLEHAEFLGGIFSLELESESF